jgi:hypothetical protein
MQKVGIPIKYAANGKWQSTVLGYILFIDEKGNRKHFESRIAFTLAEVARRSEKEEKICQILEEIAEHPCPHQA